MSEDGSGLSRRNFLRMVGAAGGAAAVHETMVAMGLMNHPNAWAGPPELDRDIGRGRSVLILGAGVAGLVLADYLRQTNFEVTILEAQDRLGGRNHTARRGDKVIEDGGEQVCKFDPRTDGPEFYVNLGPGRIPYHHRRAMALCQDLGVPLEVYVHTSDANLHRMNSLGPAPRSRFKYDTQGYISELLIKAINQGALNRELNEGDRDLLKSLLVKFGDLDGRNLYAGSTRAGCRRQPDVAVPCEPVDRLGLSDLLRSRFWDPCRIGGTDPSCTPARYRSYGHGFYQVDEILWQTTSFQPIGGMDRIVDELQARLEADERVGIETGAVVDRIAFDGRQVVAYATGGKKVEADFCVSSIPFPVLKRIRKAGFSQPFVDAIGRRTTSNSCKVGWQANRRFWQESHQIYGGISWTEHPITQIWYPSNDYSDSRGVLTGAYNYGRQAEAFGKLSFEQRLLLAHQGGVQMHGNAFSEAVPRDRGISIAWQRVKHIEGCSATWILPDDDERTRQQKRADYARLLGSDLGGRFFVVGDQMSTLPGWQEGALMSAEHVLHQIARDQAATFEQLMDEVKEAPMSLDVMG